MSRQQKSLPPPLWKQLSNFTNTHPLGIEKTLRFIQAICTVLSSSIFVSYAPNAEYALKCASARSQIALARRYLRFFRFIDAFDAGYSAWLTPASLEFDAVKKIASVGKWSFLGIYFLLEDFTILDAMGLWVTPWSQVLVVECHKWWFYAILLGIIGSTIEIFFPTVSKVSPSSKQPAKGSNEKNSQEKKQEDPIPPRRDLMPIVKSLIIDSCDILVPGSFLGWIRASPTQVGLAMSVSTLLASGDIWAKANKYY